MSYLLLIIFVSLSSIVYGDSIDIDSLINTLRNPFESRLPIIVEPTPAPEVIQNPVGVASQNQQSNWSKVSSTVNQVVNKLPEVIEKPKISLEGLVWSDEVQAVIIGGRILNVGDQFNGMKIISVSKSGAKILYKGIEFVYEIN